jgi:hypothetical protein
MSVVPKILSLNHLDFDPLFHRQSNIAGRSDASKSNRSRPGEDHHKPGAPAIKT